MEIFGYLGIGTIIGIVIQYFLEKSRTQEDRQYNLKKEILRILDVSRGNIVK